MFAPQLLSCEKESFGLCLSSYLLHWKQGFDTSTLVEDRSLPIIVVAEAGKRLSGVILGTKFPLSHYMRKAYLPTMCISYLLLCNKLPQTSAA